MQNVTVSYVVVVCPRWQRRHDAEAARYDGELEEEGEPT